MLFPRFTSLFFSVFALLAATLAPSASAAVEDEAASPVVRVTGADAVDVAAEAVRASYTAGQPVTFVVNVAAHPDGMVAAARAAGAKAPIVLVEATAIPQSARTALQHLDSDRIVIVGGSAVVSRDVERQLVRYARSGVERVAGASRYQTAAALAARYGAGVGRLYVAGGNGYADAFTGGGLAGQEQAPMLLVRRNTLVASTVAELERLRPNEIVVLGGEAMVSNTVVRLLRPYAVSGQVTRIAGPNRYASAAEIAQHIPDSDGLYVLNGKDYALGAVGAALTGLTGHALLLTRASSVPAVTASAIEDMKPSSIHVLGTDEAIRHEVVRTLMKVLSQTAPGAGRGCTVAPPSGTLFGANASTRGKTLGEGISDIDEAFGTVPVVRHFSSGLPFAWDSRKAELLNDRTLVVSFKENPRRISSGSLDGFFRDWFANAPSDQTIYWSYFHEPENDISAGDFTAAEYRAAWTHLSRLADEACKPNMFATLILTEWTMNPQANRDYRVYDAGRNVVDVVAFDPYNGVWDPDRDYYKSPDKLLGHIVQTMKQDGRPWGIAEIGSRIIPGDDGSGRAAWLKDISRYAESHDALFVTYFHAIGNADWRLRDRPSRNAWAEVVSTGGGE